MQPEQSLLQQQHKEPFRHVSWEFALVQRTQLAVLRSCLKHGHLNTQCWLLRSAAVAQPSTITAVQISNKLVKPHLLRASGRGSTGQERILVHQAIAL